MLFSRKRSDGNNLVRDWVVPVDQPVLWVFQPPRSGGTLFLRLLDGHPQIHVHPAPMNNVRWQAHPDIKKISAAFSLAKHNDVGFFKHASKRKQPITPIYFDVEWYDTILADLPKDTSREVFNACSTACLNAWRNYQNLYGEKRYQVMHSTIWERSPTAKMIDNFFAVYPDGNLLFIARKPEDWLASALGQGGLYDEMDDPLKEYVAPYQIIDQATTQYGKKIIILKFDDLVRHTERTLKRLFDQLGTDYHPACGITTANGIPVPANSSHDIEPIFAPDPSLIGRGAEIIDTARALPKYTSAMKVFNRLLSRAAQDN